MQFGETVEFAPFFGLKTQRYSQKNKQDGKEITMQQRKFLQDRAMMRARRKAARPAKQQGGGAGSRGRRWPRE